MSTAEDHVPLRNPYWLIAQRGAVTWNSWIRIEMSGSDAHRYGISNIEPLSPVAQKQLAARLSLDGLPDPSQVNFDGLKFSAKVDFSGFIFPSVSFYETEFESEVSFEKARFLADASFVSTTFGHGANFTRAAFQLSLTFQHSTFGGDLYFEGAEIRRDADFFTAQFDRAAYFNGTKFFANAKFENCKFAKTAYFDSCAFSGSAEFTNATFVGPARFRQCEFGDEAKLVTSIFRAGCDFSKSTFNAGANFGHAIFREDAIFDHCKFSAATSFQSAAFGEPPHFHGAELHPDTSFFRTEFLVGAESAVSLHSWDARRRAWRTLRQRMNAVHAHEEEHQFLTLELRARSRIDGPIFFALTSIYRFVSDFGRSVVRPLIGIAVTALIAMTAYWSQLKDAPDPACPDLLLKTSICDLGALATYSAIHAFPLIGQSRTTETLYLRLFESGRVLPLLLTMAQNVTSLFLLFLMGLALRNAFRIK